MGSSDNNGEDRSDGSLTLVDAKSDRDNDIGAWWLGGEAVNRSSNEGCYSMLRQKGLYRCV